MDLIVGMYLLISTRGIERALGKVEQIRTVKMAPVKSGFTTPAGEFIPAPVALFKPHRIAMVSWINEFRQQLMFPAFETETGEWVTQDAQPITFEAWQPQ